MVQVSLERVKTVLQQVSSWACCALRCNSLQKHTPVSCAWCLMPRHPLHGNGPTNHLQLPLMGHRLQRQTPINHWKVVWLELRHSESSFVLSHPTFGNDDMSPALHSDTKRTSGRGRRQLSFPVKRRAVQHSSSPRPGCAAAKNSLTGSLQMDSDVWMPPPPPPPLPLLLTQGAASVNKRRRWGLTSACNSRNEKWEQLMLQ